MHCDDHWGCLVLVRDRKLSVRLGNENQRKVDCPKPKSDPAYAKRHELWQSPAPRLSARLSYRGVYKDWLCQKIDINMYWRPTLIFNWQQSSVVLTELHNLFLLLPPDAMTYKRHDGENRSNLVSSSSIILKTLTTCCLKEDVHHGSDHYPINASFAAMSLSLYG
jgi:hypothetical protein